MGTRAGIPYLNYLPFSEHAARYQSSDETGLCCQSHVPREVSRCLVDAMKIKEMGIHVLDPLTCKVKVPSRGGTDWNGTHITVIFHNRVFDAAIDLGTLLGVFRMRPPSPAGEQC